MFAWLTSLFRRRDPAEEFRQDPAGFARLWFDTAARSGQPKWLTWTTHEVTGEPLFVRTFALLPVLVTFEPIPDSPLADVPQARDPRSVVAVFTHDGRTWTTTGKAVFNLTPQQVAERTVKPPIESDRPSAASQSG